MPTTGLRSCLPARQVVAQEGDDLDDSLGEDLDDIVSSGGGVSNSRSSFD